MTINCFKRHNSDILGYQEIPYFMNKTYFLLLKSGISYASTKMKSRDVGILRDSQSAPVPTRLLVVFG